MADFPRVLADAQDDCLLAIEDGRPVPVAALRKLPPFRASLMANIAAKAGVPLERGTTEQVRAEAAEVGGAGHLGAWWERVDDPACQADPLDGGVHAGPVAEYVRLCFRNHERAGQLCEACAGPPDEHGLRKVKCGECDGPAVMVTRAQWADFLARRQP